MNVLLRIKVSWQKRYNLKFSRENLNLCSEPFNNFYSKILQEKVKLLALMRITIREKAEKFAPRMRLESQKLNLDAFCSFKLFL